MTNVATASKEQVDWAIGIIDLAGEGGEVDADDFFKASAVLTVVSYAAFELAEENDRLRTLFQEQAPLTYEIVWPELSKAAEQFPALIKHCHQLEGKNKRLQKTAAAYGDYIRGEITLSQLEQALIEASENEPRKP